MKNRGFFFMVVALGLLAGTLGLGLASWFGCKVFQVNQTTVPDKYETVLNNRLDVIPDPYVSSDSSVLSVDSVSGVSVPDSSDDMILSKFEDVSSGLSAGVVSGSSADVLRDFSRGSDSDKEGKSKVRVGFLSLFFGFLSRIWWLLLVLLIFIGYKILKRKKR